MLYSRQYPQTSTGIWHRARPQQRPGVHEGGALASEAGDVWDNSYFLCLFFVALQHVKNQHLTALNKRRRPEWCTLMLERRGETKRPHAGTSCKTHISRSFHAILPDGVMHNVAVLCRAVSRIFVAVSRALWGFSVPARLSRCPLLV